MWHSLVHVKVVKAGKQVARQLYKSVDDDADDNAAKLKVIEVANNATNKILEKVSKDNVAGFQSYTIVNMQGKISTESDIDQFKLLNVKEQPLDNKLKYLDVLRFPVLFPNGNLVNTIHAQFKFLTLSMLNHAYWTKTLTLERILNVFYLLFQKHMRELSSEASQCQLHSFCPKCKTRMSIKS